MLLRYHIKFKFNCYEYLIIKISFIVGNSYKYIQPSHSREGIEISCIIPTMLIYRRFGIQYSYRILNVLARNLYPTNQPDYSYPLSIS